MSDLHRYSNCYKHTLLLQRFTFTFMKTLDNSFAHRPIAYTRERHRLTRHHENRSFASSLPIKKVVFIQDKRIWVHCYCVAKHALPYCIVFTVSKHLYSAFHNAHQSEALPVRETQREENSLMRTKSTWLTS